MARRLALASLRARFRSALFLAVALAVATVTMASVEAVLSYQSERVLDPVRTVRGADIVLRGVLDEADIGRLGLVEGVAHVETGLLLPASYLGEQGYLAGISVPSQVFRLRENLRQGRLPDGAGSFAAPTSFAQRLGLELGAGVSFGVGYDRDGDASVSDLFLRLAGIVEDDARVPRLPFVRVELLRQASGLHANLAMLLLEDGADVDLVVSRLRREFPGANLQVHESVYREAQVQRSAAATVLRSYLVLLAASVGLLVWTLSTAQARVRQPELGTLLSLGCRPVTLAAAGMLEVAAVTAAGWIGGLALLPLVISVLERYRIYATISLSGALPALGVISAAAAVSWLWPLAGALRRPVRSLLRAEG